MEEGRSDRRSHRKNNCCCSRCRCWAPVLFSSCTIRWICFLWEICWGLTRRRPSGPAPADQLHRRFFHRAVCGDRRSRLAGGRREKRGEDPEDHSHCRGHFPARRRSADCSGPSAVRQLLVWMNTPRRFWNRVFSISGSTC